MDNIIENIKTMLEEFKKVVPSFKFNPSDKFYPYKKPTEQWPNSDKPGVYIFIADGDIKPLYVGKCERYLGNRIWSHVGKKGEDIKDLFPYAEEWIKSNRDKLYFITIPVVPSWLAPALESFLISKLDPMHNRQGKE